MKNHNTTIIFISTILLTIYLLLVGLFYPYKTTLINIQVDLWIVLLIMVIFELLSTITFQLRIIYTQKYIESKKEHYRFLASGIAAISWIIAGCLGILLINGNDSLTSALLKFVPVAIATFNGVFITLGAKNGN